MQAVKLRYFKDMTYKQIAEQLDITIENVRSLLSKALAKLRYDKAIRELNDEYSTHRRTRSMFFNPLHYLTGYLY